MMKYRLFLYAILLCFLISACTGQNLREATDVPTITLTPKPPTITPTSTITSTPSPTVRPSDTPIPTVVWAKSGYKIVQLDHFSGEWSPTANEMVGVEIHDDVRFNHLGKLVLSSAPDFSRVVLDQVNKDTALDSFTWYPDGQKILYGVSPFGGVLSIDYAGKIWSVGRDGTNPHNLDIGFGRGLEFWDWMDSHTIVYSSYAGGGHLAILEYDILADEFLADDAVHVFQKGPPDSSYVPVIDCTFHCTTCILTRKKTVKPEVYPCRSENFYAREFPRLPQDVYAENYVDTVFQSWQSGTNKMLILAQGKEGGNNQNDPYVSRLLLWNTDTDQVTSIVPGGVFGRFSPDGKMLAFITYGPSNQYASASLQKLSFDLIDINNTPTLQLMDVGTRRIMMSMPVKTEIIEFGDGRAISEWNTTIPDAFSFSPHSRYMAFSTIGSITLKDEQFPTETIITDPSIRHLNILDLKTEQLIKSLPINGPKENSDLNLLWSPNSEKFIYQDGNENWHLFNLSTKTSSPITQGNGSELWSPAWSYDGSYLRFFQYQTDGYDKYGAILSKTTFILNLRDLP